MNFTINNNKKLSSDKASGCFAIGWILFSSIFVIVGLAISIQQAKRWTWEEAPCEILEFKIKVQARQDDPFRAQVRFAFQAQGREYIGTKITDSENDYAEFEDLIKDKREALKKGTCYFDPKQPEEAVLQRNLGGIWGGLAFAIFGSLFVLVGVALLRTQKAEKKAISSKGKDDNAMTAPILIAFFSIFALAGIAMLFALTVPMMSKYFAAKEWEPVEATVIWSKVRSQSSDDGTTYRPDIFYRYQFKGEKFRSNSFSLSSSSSSGRSAKQEVVAAYPRGHRFTCYVNPQSPWQAIVQREFGWWALWGIFPLPFLGVGLGGLWWGLKNYGKISANKMTGSASHPTSASKTGRPPRKAKKGNTSNRWLKFLGALFFALFWCGIVSVFVTMAWNNWAGGHPDWFLNIFLIPFVLVGLLSIAFLPYSFLAIFSPKFDFKLPEEELKLGLASKLSWRQTGGSGQLSKMTISLEGKEEANYQQGTDRTTATSLFYQKALFQSTRASEMIANECDLIFPADALPTFEGAYNQIHWSLRIHGVVKNRPDVRDEIELTLQPLTENDFR